MTRPSQTLMWMILFLAVVAVTVVLIHGPLVTAFLTNPALNGLILGVFLVGILINFRQVTRLSGELTYIDALQGTTRQPLSASSPRLLAPMARMLEQHEQEPFSLSPLSLRSLLDGIRLRLDESRDVARYMIGLLIFLGLLGTFWGLLVTIGSVGDIISGLDAGSGAVNGGSMFDTLKQGLQRPLAGMGTAFSSSLFGLAGSLVLGFLDLQAGHAQNRFFNELEDYLSGVTRLSSELAQGGEREISVPSYIHAMLEQTADTLDKLQRSTERDEALRRVTGEQLATVGDELATLTDQLRTEQRLLHRLAEGQADLAPVLTRLADTSSMLDEATQDHIRSLDVGLKRLLEEITGGREQLISDLRNELRLVGRTVAALADERLREQG